jgi:hypothetical protein
MLLVTFNYERNHTQHTCPCYTTDEPLWITVFRLQKVSKNHSFPNSGSNWVYLDIAWFRLRTHLAKNLPYLHISVSTGQPKSHLFHENLNLRRTSPTAYVAKLVGCGNLRNALTGCRHVKPNICINFHMKLLYETFTAPGVQSGTGQLNIRRISWPHYYCVLGGLALLHVVQHYCVYRV